MLQINSRMNAKHTTKVIGWTTEIFLLKKRFVLVDFYLELLHDKTERIMVFAHAYVLQNQLPNISFDLGSYTMSDWH